MAVDWSSAGYTWIGFLSAAGSGTSDELMFNYSNSENFADRANNNSRSSQQDDEESKSTNITSSSGSTVLLVQWDDWDQSLWTAEQRQLLERGGIPPEVHITLGVLLTLIVLFGVAANSSIFYVFAR